MTIIKWPLFLYAALLISYSCDRAPSEFIAVNMAGYQPEQVKLAFLVGKEAEKFEILRAAEREVIYSGSVGRSEKPDHATGDVISPVDFSNFTAAGEYFIRLKEYPDIISQTFRIDDDVYSVVTETVLQSYYYHRCGTGVNNGEPWRYEKCHLEDAAFFNNRELNKNTAGGWHDAGDYNKFSINTALSAGLLLYLYELKPDAFTDAQLNIPESGNGIPDLLDEVSWALDWLMKMQRPDGGIFHKVSQKKWTGEYLPHEDPETRYIFEISTSATAGFAAVTALGARLIEEFDRDFSSQLAAASKKSWQYLERNPRQQPEEGFRNPPGVHGGEYRDPDDSDERLWASIELYKLNKDKKYLHYFMDAYREMTPDHIPPVSWKNFHTLAFSSFLNLDTAVGLSAGFELHNKNGHLQEFAKIREQLHDLLMTHADSILHNRDNNNYLNLLHPSEYYWGSNSVGLAYSFDLIQAFRHSGSEKYREAALDQLHYVLGRNPFNLSQVTGTGARSVQNPYHQLSEMGGFSRPVPGMLVGGPNNHLHLGGSKLSSYPGKNYEDRFNNYLVNEPAINFTAILAYVSGYFSLTHEPIVFN